MYKKIMIPLDGSTLAETALTHGIELANAFQSDLYLIQVVVHMIGGLSPYEVEYQLNETYREAALREAHEYLNRIAQNHKEQVKGVIHTKVIEGIVIDSLLEYAEFQMIDLIVMATHGRSGVSRWVFGSVAERLLRAAKCPVFLVRAVQDEKQV